MEDLKTGSWVQALQILLSVVAVGLLIWSTPWNSTTETHKITVNGTGTVKSAPDSYQFAPSYEETGTEPDSLIAAMTSKANDVTAKLKELGVKEEDISLQSNVYNQDWLDTGETQVVSFSLTIEVVDKDLAQKVQDYLLTTAPQGAISPYSIFSDKKQKELEKQAREEAIDDARTKAEEIAKETGVKVGKVIEISDGYSGGGVVTLEDKASSVGGAALSLPILSGKQEVSVSITVSFAIK